MQHTNPFSPTKKSTVKKNTLKFLGVVMLFLAGTYVGYAYQPSVNKVTNVAHKDQGDVVNTADFAEFWKVWTMIDEKYPQAKNISAQDRIYGAIQGLVASTKDPYTMYFPPVESKKFEEEVAGSFSGIGVEIGVKNGLLTVIAPLKDSPAERAGIRAGDYFFKIDDLSVADMTLDESIDHIRGKEGTTVKLTIMRKDESKPIDLMVTRGIINIPTIDETDLGDTYLISLYNFNANSTDLAHKAFVHAKENNKKNIILDLRGNPGGYLEAAVSIASEFLPEGAVIVSEDYGGNREPLIHRSKGYSTIPNTVKLVVLLDKGSASASEIVAGALKDHNRATIIGETSFGKGSVQELLPVSKDTSIKITIANWMTPNGSTISGKGISPTITVPQDQSTETTAVVDTTITRALEFLRTGK